MLCFTEKEVEKIRQSRSQLNESQNIIGMQANLWSEMLRDVTMTHSQLFPRLIAFAERAWHKVMKVVGEVSCLTLTNFFCHHWVFY